MWDSISSSHRLWISIAGKVPRRCRDDIEFYSIIIHALPDLIWLKALDSIYLACNHRFKGFLGASEQDILGKTDYDFLNTRLADLFQEHDQEVILQASPSKNEEWATFVNDGHCELLEIKRLPIYDDKGKLIGVLGIGHNITNRRESEGNLQKSEERISLAKHRANDGIWDWNLETNQVY